MWPPVAYNDITLEMIFYSWKDRVLINKTLKEHLIWEKETIPDTDTDTE